MCCLCGHQPEYEWVARAREHRDGLPRMESARRPRLSDEVLSFLSSYSFLPGIGLFILLASFLCSYSVPSVLRILSFLSSYSFLPGIGLFILLPSFLSSYSFLPLHSFLPSFLHIPSFLRTPSFFYTHSFLPFFIFLPSFLPSLCTV